MRKGLFYIIALLVLTAELLPCPFAHSAIVGTVSAISGPVALPIWFVAGAVGMTPGAVIYGIGVAVDAKNSKQSGESTDSFSIVGGLGAGLGAAFAKIGGIFISIAGLGIALDAADVSQVQISTKFFESENFKFQSIEAKKSFIEEVPMIESAMKEMFQVAESDQSLTPSEATSLWNELTADLSLSSKSIFENAIYSAIESSEF